MGDGEARVHACRWDIDRLTFEELATLLADVRQVFVVLGASVDDMRGVWNLANWLGGKPVPYVTDCDARIAVVGDGIVTGQIRLEMLIAEGLPIENQSLLVSMELAAKPFAAQKEAEFEGRVESGEILVAEFGTGDVVYFGRHLLKVALVVHFPAHRRILREFGRHVGGRQRDHVVLNSI